MRVLAPLLCVTLVLAAAAPAHAQFKTLKKGTDDIDMGADKTKRPVIEDDLPVEEPTGFESDVFVPGRRRYGDDEADAGYGRAKKVRAVDAGTTGDAGVGDAGDGGTPAIPGIPALNLVPPPADGEAALLGAWATRRQAVAKSVARDMAEQEKTIVQLRRELGCPNLFVMAAGLVAEVDALMPTDGPEALRRAVLASELAPDLPAAHWAVARAAFKEDLTNVGRYIGSTGDALSASWREPRWRTALVADLAAALIGAFLLAAAGVVVLLFLRHARYFLHDFHHLFPRGAWQAQTALAGLLVLSLPLLFELGPFAFLLGLALASWLHLSGREKVVVATLFVLSGLAPISAMLAERYTEFGGTRAEAIWLVERGGPDDPSAVARLRALSERADAPFEAIFALGRRARLRGEFPAAINLLRQAAEQRPSSADALLELGNALALSGDSEGARETWQRVLSVRETSIPAHQALARLFDGRAKAADRANAAPLITETQAHHRRIIELDPKLGAALAQGGELDLHANAWLLPAPVDVDELWELARAEGQPAWVGEDVAGRLFWFLPREYAFLAGPAAALLLGLLTLLARVLAPSSPCGKCGRPVCRRCDAEVVGPAMCGQCLTVFAQRVAVDPPARAAKEAQIKRYQRRRVWTIRLAAALAPGGGQLISGQPVLGGALLLAAALGGWFAFFRNGLVPTPWGESPAGLRLVPAVLVFVLSWALGLRLAVRATAATNLIKVGPATPAAPTDPRVKADPNGAIQIEL